MLNQLRSNLRRVARSVIADLRQPLALAHPSHLSPTRGRALLSYIDVPFRRSDMDHTHSNWAEVRLMARVLQEIGYAVSVIDFQSRAPLHWRDYQLIIGFGDPMQRSCHEDYEGRRILLATGTNPCHNNLAEARRLRAFEQRHGALLKTWRMAFSCGASIGPLCDAIFTLGNEFTISTLKEFGRPIYRVPVTYSHHWKASQITRDHGKCRRSYLWFGSGGAIHKGLDLVIDAMDLLDKDFTLHICGPVQNEPDFFDFYRAKLSGDPRIHYHGFMDIRGQQFMDVLGQCGLCVFPSCAEGGGSAVLTCMSTGLAPVVTPAASIDVMDFGFTIDQESPQGVARAMRDASNLPPDQLAARGAAAAKHVESAHSLEAHEHALRDALNQVLAAKQV